MKISIIVPVYRVENTIDRCINSILHQDYDDMEIIIVDDGSPDNCPEICDKWALNDNRITVIHKENGGLSDARNAGINIATGEYITFIDSDDYIEPGTLNKIMCLIKKHPEYDILEYSFNIIGEKEKGKLSLNDRVFYNTREYWTEGEAYNHSYAWNKIYKRELFATTRFPVGKIFEDMWIMPLLTAKAKTIATTSLGYYNYCWNPNGITSNANGNGLNMLLKAHIQLIEDKSLNMITDYRYYMHVVNIQMDVYEMTNEKPILKRTTIKDISKLHPKAKIKAIALNLLGLNNLCRINKTIHYLKKCL